MSKTEEKKEKKTGRKKVIIAVIAVVLAACIIGAVIVADIFKTEYQSQTKNAVAMGTIVTSKTYGKNAALKNESIITIIQQLDDEISWRVSSSSVAKLNESGSVQDAALADIINACYKVSKDSEGAFDITTGELSELWGIGTQDERIPSEQEIEKALENVDYASVTTVGTKISCADGQFIDLGAIGKGYACDVVRKYLEKTSVEGAVVSVGGSVVAYGKRNKAGDKWRIAIRDPRSQQGFIGTVNIDEGFVSTSGDYERYFEKDGVRYHHLLDPKTGYLAKSGLISVTVICDNGLLSDALSTACFILGKDKGAALAEKYSASAVFVDEQMNISVVGDVDFERAQ